MKHTTVKPSNAESNNNDNNDELRTYEPRSIHELLGFVRAAANQDDYEYTNLQLTFKMERKD